MKKLLKTVTVIVCISALLSSVLLTHAAPVDTVFDEFFGDNSDRIDEFEQAMKDNNATMINDIEMSATNDGAADDFIADLDMTGYVMSTYVEKRSIDSDDHEKIFGNMRELSQEQIEENLKTFDFGKFIETIPADQIIRTNPDLKGFVRSAGRRFGDDTFTYTSGISGLGIPLSYDELEEIIKSELGNVEISNFEFVSLAINMALYFESDKGNYFIPVTAGPFVARGKLYTQHEYLSLALDSLYENANFSALGGGGAGGVPLSESGNSEATPVSDTTATLVTIGLGIFVLAILVLVSKVKRREVKK